MTAKNLMPGIHEAQIVSHSVGCTQSGTPFAKINFRIGKEEVASSIWLSDKATSIARVELQRCGFDVDRDSIEKLRDEPEYLAGNKVSVEVGVDPEWGI